MSRNSGLQATNSVEIEELRHPYCQFCGRKTSFAKPPVELKTRVGARRRLAGHCSICNSKLSLFLPSDSGPTVHSVRVSKTRLRELQRASLLLVVSQRLIIESILEEHLEGFIVKRLAELEDVGEITEAERCRRERSLREPIEDWTPGDKGETESASGLLEMLRKIIR